MSDSYLFCSICHQQTILTNKSCHDNPTIRISSCPSCSSERIDVDISFNIHHYESDFYFTNDKKVATLERELDWNIKRHEYIKDMIPALDDSSLLDFGCGYGGFLRELASKSAYGYDLSPNVVYNNNRDGLQCVNNLNDLPQKPTVLTLFHVLEHIPCPVTFLSKIVTDMPSISDIIIEVPNAAEVLQTYFNSKSFVLNNYHSEHVWYFSELGLRKLSTKIDFHVVNYRMLHRYQLSNLIGWLIEGKGGYQDVYSLFNDVSLNQRYEETLIDNKLADTHVIHLRKN